MLRWRGWQGGMCFLASLALLAAAGCNFPTKGSVKGKVKYKGNVLKAGSVVFVTEKGSFSTRIQEDGGYFIPEVPVGVAKIGVQTNYLKPAEETTTPKGQAPPSDKNTNSPAAAAQADMLKKYVPIPMKYEDSGTSGLKYTVVGGENEKNIDLEDPVKP